MLSTIITFLLLPPKYFKYLPWALLVIVMAGAIRFFFKMSRDFEKHEAELQEEIARLKRNPYNDHIKAEVERAVGGMSEEYRDILKAILLHGPITTHDVGSRVRRPMSEIESALGAIQSTGLLARRNMGGMLSYDIQPQYNEAVKDFLFKTTR